MGEPHADAVSGTVLAPVDELLSREIPLTIAKTSIFQVLSVALYEPQIYNYCGAQKIHQSIF